MHKIIYFITALLFTSNVSMAQNIISYEKVATKSLEEMVADYGFFMRTGVDHYSVRYTTTNLDGQLDTASGLFSIPIDLSFSYPLCIHQHGTVGGRWQVPSQLSGGYEIGEVVAGINMIALSPDFMGLGTSRGQHPYIHADSEASVAIDMMYAFQEFAAMENVSYNDQIFITGYSQGGHASMAVHRELEQNYQDEFSVTAAGHLSGPYSVSEKMVEFTLGDNEYFFVAYLANVALSMQVAYPEIRENYSLEDVFKAEYIPPMMEFQDETIDLFELNDVLIGMLQNNFGRVTPKDMLQDSILEALKNDPTHPMSMALARQDVYDWAPQAPTRIVYCEADDQVFYENAILAEEVMNANGAPTVLALSGGADLDHGGCVEPALTNVFFFFLPLINVSSSTSIAGAEPEYRLEGNLHTDQLNLLKSASRKVGDEYYIIDTNGNPVQRGKILKANNALDISSLASGHYILIIENVAEMHRFFKM